LKKYNILRQIKNEVSDKLAKFDKYNNYARLINKKVEENNKRALFQLLKM